MILKGMQLQGISLENFRNLSLLRLDNLHPSTFFLGQNGQGKTNLLEAIGFLTALRSFRTRDIKSIINWKHKAAALLFKIDHEQFGESEIEIQLQNNKKAVYIDGEKLKRFSDFIGKFPTVTFSSQDIQLLRGSPQLRRRFLDLIFSTSNPEYLQALQNYSKTLQERNSLLKKEASDIEFKVFEKLMAPNALKIIQLRKQGLEQLNQELTKSYNIISGKNEESPKLEYKAHSQFESLDQILESYEKNRKRDQILKSTSQGPHKDDFDLKLFNVSAKEFASEGQQRGLVLALRLAQANFFQNATQIKPLILADDILGELDEQRTLGFWKCINEDLQIFATGTSKPEEIAQRDWQIHNIKAGALRE